MEIDIRSSQQEEITLIRFHDGNIDDRASVADTIEKAEVYGVGVCIAINESGNDDDVRIVSVEHARNLITAIEKAIELGWLD